MIKTSKLISIADSPKFKLQNKTEWQANSDFWLEGKMRHISDVKNKTIGIIQSLMTNNNEDNIKSTLIDVGCGEGWVYRAIKEASIDINYYGIDYNEKFIQKLKSLHMNDTSAFFLKDDIEENEIKELQGIADIIVNAFNFFEIPELGKAMSHTSQLLKRGGILLILTIDPITQLLSICNNQATFYNYLYEYATKKSSIGYKKRIVIDDKKTKRNYYGILYSLEDYLRESKKNNMIFQDYYELLNPSLPTPQLYQFMTFKKS